MAWKESSPNIPDAPLVPLEAAREDVVTEEDVVEAVEEGALTNGPAAAAILASGIGSMALGLIVTLTAASLYVEEALNFYEPVGPLGGKTTLAVVVWLIAWFVLNNRWKNEQVYFARTFRATLILIALGLLGTFPPFYGLFHHGG